MPAKGIPVHLREIVTSGTLYTKQRSLHRQKKHTLDCVTQHSTLPKPCNDVCSFRNERYKNVTELSKHIWSLKERKINYQIKWRKVKQAKSYSNVNKKCNLCLWEKYFIICQPEMSTLNRRNEMTSTCRHWLRSHLSFFYHSKRKFIMVNEFFNVTGFLPW